MGIVIVLLGSARYSYVSVLEKTKSTTPQTDVEKAELVPLHSTTTTTTETEMNGSAQKDKVNIRRVKSQEA
jgi:hypothetical protein